MRVLCIHQERESSLGSLAAPVGERGHVLEHWRAWSGEPLPALEGYGAVYALGGVVHPDQDREHPWLGVERAAMRELVDRGVPLLGVCLGAQLLASSFGAAVGRLEQGELGWLAVETTPEAAADPLLGGFPETFPAFQWHEYGFGLPAGSTRLAGSPRCANQAFRLGERTWALQFHIEVDAAIVATWTVEGADELVAKGIAADGLLEDTARHVDAYVALAHGLSQRFLAVAEASAGERAA